MKDQVDNLEKSGITEAVTINGMLDPIERAKSFERVENGSASMLYISPESLRSRTIERLLLGRKIARFVIDEAHCFSSWGQDFRVDYLYIADFIKLLQEKKNLSFPIPVSCFTATAKQKVIEDIRVYFYDNLSLKLEIFSANASKSKQATSRKKMLENLTQYLRASLNHTRNETNRLKQEMETIQSYLDINKIRMGDRLNFKIEIPKDLYNISFPPMLIQPIVENAVKHGIEPKIEGGIVSIKISNIVSGKEDVLKIEIADTGVGFNSNLSTGIGLENVKNRLKALYQDKSSIIFETNNPSGLKVTIGVPYEKDNSNNC